jgi:hypothetical protein
MKYSGKTSFTIGEKKKECEKKIETGENERKTKKQVSFYAKANLCLVLLSHC